MERLHFIEAILVGQDGTSHQQKALGCARPGSSIHAVLPDWVPITYNLLADELVAYSPECVRQVILRRHFLLFCEPFYRLDLSNCPLTR